MRILLSNASAAWGGVHRVTEVLAAGLMARGHEVVLLCRPGSSLEARMRGRVPTSAVLLGMDLSPIVLTRVWRVARGFRPTVGVMLMKKDMRLTAPVMWAMGVPILVRHANDRPLRRGAYHRLLYGTMPAHHVTNAQATRRTLLGSAPWLRPDDVSVIYNGIDPRPFDDVAPARLGLPRGAVAVGFVGRFDAHKGVHDLAAAWPAVAAAVPAAHLVVTGKGPLEAEIRRALAAAPRVTWTGYRSDVPAVMKALDVLVLPSHVEGAPNVVLEAMAAGIPAVATAVSGTPELLRDGVDGVLVPPRDPEALARALIRVATDAELRGRMGRAGHERARTAFREQAMIDAYEALLQDLVSRRGRT